MTKRTGADSWRYSAGWRWSPAPRRTPLMDPPLGLTSQRRRPTGNVSDLSAGGQPALERQQEPTTAG